MIEEIKFYVASNGEEPCQIFFTFEDARNSRAKYIDVFNSEGLWVKAYKINTDGESIFYTTNF